jgi:hypothetical protein
VRERKRERIQKKLITLCAVEWRIYNRSVKGVQKIARQPRLAKNTALCLSLSCLMRKGVAHPTFLSTWLDLRIISKWKKYHFDSRWEIISHLTIWTELKVWKQFYFLLGQNWITKIHGLWWERYMYRLKLFFSLKCISVHKPYQFIYKWSTGWVIYVECTWCLDFERIKKPISRLRVWVTTKSIFIFVHNSNIA